MSIKGKRKVEKRMVQMTWTLSAKDLDPKTKYIPFKKYDGVSSTDFLASNILKEVRQEKKKNLKKYAKICTATIAASALLLALVHPTFAATLPGHLAMAASGMPSPLPATVPNAILPKDIVKVGAYLIGISMSASSILAVILAQLAGGYRMIRKGDEATKWTTDILKGYTQVILAPVVIGVIAFAVYLLFGSYDWFLKIF
jgi:hypothetical protein